LAALCRSLRNQGRPVEERASDDACANRAGTWLCHERLGYNYRLSEVAAALGIAQMERLDELLKARRNVAGMYMRRLMDWQEIILPSIDPDLVDDMSWFVFVLRLNDMFGPVERDRIILGLRRHEIGAANYFPCIHLQPYMQPLGYQKGMFPVAESISQRTLALPFYSRMDEMQVELVCQTLRVMLQREQLLKRS
jgi:perosamine synthetase